MWDLIVSVPDHFLSFYFVGLINPRNIPAAPRLGKNINRGISATHFKPANFAE